jgi:hypothetical protein
MFPPPSTYDVQSGLCVHCGPCWKLERSPWGLVQVDYFLFEPYKIRKKLHFCGFEFYNLMQVGLFHNIKV